MAHGSAESGWGRLKVEAAIGETSWGTSIWFDTKSGSYLLSINTKIRKKVNLHIGEFVSVQLYISDVFGN